MGGAWASDGSLACSVGFQGCSSTAEQWRIAVSVGALRCWKAAFSLVISSANQPNAHHRLAVAPQQHHHHHRPYSKLLDDTTSPSDDQTETLEKDYTPQDTQKAARMPGFDFSNYNRNAALHARGIPLPKATSTGTTIVGCIFEGGVVVGSPSQPYCYASYLQRRRNY